MRLLVLIVLSKAMVPYLYPGINVSKDGGRILADEKEPGGEIFFQFVESTDNLNTSSSFDMACLWFYFSEVLQKALDELKHIWNTHRIRKSRYDIIAGRLNVLDFQS